MRGPAVSIDDEQRTAALTPVRTDELRILAGERGLLTE
jgi:hypothetical protein